MRQWILLGKEDSCREFWRYIHFPLNYWGESAYEIRAGHRDCKNDYDCFIEKSAFMIYYNPWTDKFRMYTYLRIPKTVKIIDPDYLWVDECIFGRIEKYSVNGRDFIDKIVKNEL